MNDALEMKRRLKGQARYLSRVGINLKHYKAGVITLDEHTLQTLREIQQKKPEEVTQRDAELIDDFCYASGCPFFSNLLESQRYFVYKNVKFRELEKGDVLFREGDPGTSFFIIVDGILDVLVRFKSDVGDLDGMFDDEGEEDDKKKAEAPGESSNHWVKKKTPRTIGMNFSGPFSASRNAPSSSVAVLLVNFVR